MPTEQELYNAYEDLSLYERIELAIWFKLHDTAIPASLGELIDDNILEEIDNPIAM